MKIDEARQRAFAMPSTGPSYPPGPYRFAGREFFVIDLTFGLGEVAHDYSRD